MTKYEINSNRDYSCIDECSRCGTCKTKVIDSRFDETLSLRIRTKQCSKCGFRWPTVEIMLDELVIDKDIDIVKTYKGVTEAKEKINKSLKEAKVAINNMISIENNIKNALKAVETVEEEIRA